MSKQFSIITEFSNRPKWVSETTSQFNHHVWFREIPHQMKINYTPKDVEYSSQLLSNLTYF